MCKLIICPASGARQTGSILTASFFFTKKIAALFFTVFMFASAISNATKTTWNGSTSTAWATAANWTTSNGGSAPPSATDTVIIVSGTNQPTLPNSAVTVSVLTIQSGTLTKGGNSSALTVSNNLTINSGATLNMVGENLTVNGTLSISGTLSTTSGSTHNYNNIVINNGGAYSTTTSTINVTGNWTNNGTFTYGTSDVYFQGTTAQTITGGSFYGLHINNGWGGSCSLGGNIAVLNDLALTTGTFSCSSYIVTITHDITGTGSVLNAQTSTFTFIGTGAQNIVNGTTLNNVIVNGNGSITQPASGNINIAGNLTVISGSFDQGAAGQTTTGSGAANTLNVQANGTLIIRASGTTPYATAYPGWETLSLDDGSTIQWTTSNSKTWDITSFKNVTVSAGTNSLGGNTTITGNLTFNGGTLATTTSNYSLTTTGNFSLGGATLTANGSTITVGGNFSGTGTVNSGTSTFVFNGTGSQTIAGTGGIGAYNNIIINKASGTASTTGTITLNGNATITSGTLDIGLYSFQRVSSGGTFTMNNGTSFRLGGTQAIYNFTTYSLDATSTTEYYGTGQTLFAATYGNLILSGSNTKTMPSSAITVAGDFTMSGTCSATTASAITFNGNVTIGSGTTFSGSSYSHILKGNWTKSGTFNANTSTFTLNGTSAQTITGATAFNNLTVNNSSGISLSATTTVGGTLTLTSGLVTTGSYELNVTNTSASSIAGHSASGYVVGNLRRSVTLTGSYDFPLGTSSNYEFINLNFTAQLGVSNVLGTFTGTDPAPSGLPSPLTYSGKNYGKTLNHGYWSLTPNSSMTSGVYSVTLKGKGYTNALSSVVSDYVVIKRHDGTSSWGISGVPDLLNQLMGGGILTTIATGLTSFSDFAEATTCDVTTSAAGPDQSVCGTSATLAANTPTVGTGTWSIISGTGGSISSSSSATSTFTGTAGSTYSLEWTISNSPCSSSSDTVIIAFKQNPTTANAGTDQNICGTSATLAGNAPAIGTGTWSVISGSGGSFSNSSSAASTFTGTAGTTYSLVWTISNSTCTASSDTVVIARAATANAGSEQNICGTSATLAGNAPAMGTGTWSIINGSGGSLSNASNPSSTFSGVAGTSYTLRWTIINNPCNAAVDDVTINLNSSPSASVSASAATCTSNNGSVSLSVSGGTSPYSYSWSNGSTSSDISGLSAGNYSVTITDANGCSTSSQAEISNSSTAVSASVASNTPFVCSGSNNGSATVSASGGTTPYSYIWSNGATTQNATDLTSGIYSVTVTDANGCSTSTSLTLVSKSIPVQPDPITVTGTTIGVCPPVNGVVLQTNNDANATSYSWTSDFTAITFVNNSTTNVQTINIGTSTTSTYIVRVIASNECGVSNFRGILFRREVSIPKIYGSATACPNSVQMYSCDKVGATTYKWTATTGMRINGVSGTCTTADTVVNVTFGSAYNTGTLSVAGIVGCFTSEFKTLAISKTPPSPSVITGATTVCPQASQVYTSQPVSGAVSYIWTLPPNTTGSSTTNSINVDFGNFVVPGNICVKALNSCGILSAGQCKSVTTGSPATPGTIIASSSSFCTHPVVYTVPLVAGTTYNWTFPIGATVIGNANGNSVNVLMPGNIATGVVSAKAVNTCGISAERTLIVSSLPAAPGVITTNPSQVCANAQGVHFISDVTSSGPGCTYQWTYPATATYVSGQGTPNLTLNWGSANGTVKLKATNSCGSSTRSLAVIVGCSGRIGNPGENSSDIETLVQPTELTTEHSKENSINLQAYPDPDQKTLTFTFNSSETGTYSYSLIDDSNREVMNGTVDAQEGVNMQELDMASLPVNTVYRLKLDNGINSTHINIKMQ